MSNKKDIQEMLVNMEFKPNYITRAFKVYEKTFGHSYNVEVITEIIVRLQNKDKAKQRKKPELDIESMTVKKLKEELKARTLKTTGNKSTLKKRLSEAIQNEQTIEPEAMEIDNVGQSQQDNDPQISYHQVPPPRFNIGDTVIFEGQEAEVMKILNQHQIEITYPKHIFIMQRNQMIVSPQQLMPEHHMPPPMVFNIDHDLPFKPHMSMQDAFKLKVKDKIDHRDEVGRFALATIAEKQGTNLKIHYDGWSRTWDVWSDFQTEINRFAKAGSISRRQAHRFNKLKESDYIDVNPMYTHPGGWKCGEIRRFDHKSGQIHVIYEDNGKNYVYWAHLDDESEIAEFASKSELGNKENITGKKRKDMEKNEVNDELIMEPARKKQKLSRNDNKPMGDDKENENELSVPSNSNNHNSKVNEEQKSQEFTSFYKKEKENLKYQIIELKKQLMVKKQNGCDCICMKENERSRINMDNVDTLNEEELNELEARIQNKIGDLQGNIKSIKEAKERLLDDKLRCIACLKNQKNVVIQGCNHFDLCHECEAKLPQKTCPRCQASYDNIIKLDV